ncbi:MULTISPECIES: hypothetical protein [unclassified Caballeronia]|uniref:DUF6966 domain-containing protein n=1 Tax=unclassified Caballeronia TaxID=2646786 RepID=UPI0020287AC8|nr:MULTISPECIES: hypothetical protein [unclassified Caballeronia]
MRSQMMDIRQIEAVLSKMRDLLRIGGLRDWADALDSCVLDLPVDPSGVRMRIVSMYGGMGSLNDVVSYRNGQPLIRENNELDDLRSELYRLCHAAP